MLQSHDGPTGVRDGLDAENGEKLQRLRRERIDLPIALGFGIGAPEQAAQAIRLGADGVVVGSACIDAARGGSDSLRRFTRSLRRAINEASLNAAPG
jgi:tryptophan synthase alpha chain